eukprot:COSAG01_NODE_67859_length_265_cov_4.102410_1_plen_53_part_01
MRYVYRSNRRETMAPLISLCQLLALVVVVRSAPAPAGGEGRPKPNIVLFLTDD